MHARVNYPSSWWDLCVIYLSTRLKRYSALKSISNFFKRVLNSSSAESNCDFPFDFTFVDAVKCDPAGVDDCKVVWYKYSNPPGLSALKKVTPLHPLPVGLIQNFKPSEFEFYEKNASLQGWRLKVVVMYGCESSWFEYSLNNLKVAVEFQLPVIQF